VPDDQGAKNSLSTWSPWSRTISQRLGRLVGFDGGTDMEACQAVRRALFCELGPAGTDHAIGIFSGHLDDAVLSDGDASAGERLDRADPWRRLEADIDRLRRFQFFGHFSVVLEDALAGERLLEPVEELGGGVDLVVMLAVGKDGHLMEVFGKPGRARRDLDLPNIGRYTVAMRISPKPHQFSKPSTRRT
jgi:hypothetical protein